MQNHIGYKLLFLEIIILIIIQIVIFIFDKFVFNVMGWRNRKKN